MAETNIQLRTSWIIGAVVLLLLVIVVSSIMTSSQTTGNNEGLLGQLTGALGATMTEEEAEQLAENRLIEVMSARIKEEAPDEYAQYGEEGLRKVIEEKIIVGDTYQKDKIWHIELTGETGESIGYVKVYSDGAVVLPDKIKELF